MLNTQGWSKYFWLILFVTSVAFPPFFIQRSDTLILLPSVLVAFVSYHQLYRSAEFHFQFLAGLLARLGLFFAMPMLSDDIYRFLWDGYILKNGLNPYAELPGFYLGKSLPGLTRALYENLNSKPYFTVYPPVNQIIFWMSVMVSDNWLVSTGVIRLFLGVADIGLLYLLKKHYSQQSGIGVLYFLNPLVIIEGVGNIHFEVVVTAFLVLGLYHWHRNGYFQSALALALAVGTKLLPLIYLPYFVLKQWVQRRWVFIAVLAVSIPLLIWPLIDQSMSEGFTTSLRLYFQRFEFNASIYLLARAVGYLLTGYNEIALIGPMLSLKAALLICVLIFTGIKRQWAPEKIMCFTLSIYLLFATIIHPWYIIPLVALGLMSGYVYPLVWSIVIFITYAGYSENGHQISLVWIAMEYIIVLLAFIFNHKIKEWLTIS